MKFTQKGIYIGLFSVLYLIVAFSSFFHACSFFGLANNSWMSIILALAFEVGQAAVLFSLLTSKKDRNRIMPWVLMTMFTLVQVIGNVFSSYKYIITNSTENLRYFKEPIFIWTDIPDDQATVIIVYLVGALLPIAALLLTSMITNYLTDQAEEKLNENLSQNIVEEKNDKVPGVPTIINSKEDFDNVYDDENKEIEKELEQPNNEQLDNEIEEVQEQEKEERKEEPQEQEKEERKEETEKQEELKEQKNGERTSHFINLNK